MRLRDVEEVKDAVVCHHGKSSIFLVKGNNFGLLIDLDLREAALGVEEVGYSFHERPARLLVLGASLFVRIVSTEPIGLGFNTLFNRLVDLKDVDATVKKEKSGLEPLWKTGGVNDGDGGSGKGVFACGLCEIA